MAAATPCRSAPPAAGAAVGARLPRLDGVPKVTGRDLFGADAVPADALWIRVVRSPHARARFTLGDLGAACAHRLAAVLTAADVPFNGFGIYPDIKDQPVLADGAGALSRRGGAGAGRRARRRCWRSATTRCRSPGRPSRRCSASTPRPRADAPLVQADKPRNLLLDGGVRRGKPSTAFADCAAVAEGVFETAFVEHAYIEPEAGWARARRRPHRDPRHHPDALHGPRRGRERDAAPARGRAHHADRLRRRLRRQARSLGPAADRASPPGSSAGRWRWSTRGPRAWPPRPSAIPRASTAKFGCDAAGKLVACDVTATFDTGAYASWGPTVANRVPVHAMGPYAVPNVRTWGEAFFTNGPPAGAFRGFGVPQAAIAHEAMMDELADKLGIDRLEFRHRNALRAGDTTATRPDARPFRRPRPMPRRAAAALAEGARPRSPPSTPRRASQAARRRHRLHVVRHRQHLDVEPLAHAGRPVAGRHADALQRRGRYRPGLATPS